MKRTHTESNEMVQDFKKLKAQGIEYFYCVVRKPDGMYLRPQRKSTAQGVSSYANRMYRKYGDGTQIEVSYILWHEDYSYETKTYCTYG